MPREIKTPIRYLKEPEKRQTIRTGKRGRPRLARNEAKYQAEKQAEKKKAEPESIVIADDDSDIEIVEVTKPPNKKKKPDVDPDWVSIKVNDKKGPASRSKGKNKEKLPKTPTPVTTPTQSESVKKTEGSKTPVTIVMTKTQPTNPSSCIELYMECKDEPLSQAQIQSAKKEQSFYDMSQTLVKAAREGRLVFPPGGGMQILEKPFSMILSPMTPVIISSMPTPANVPPTLGISGETQICYSNCAANSAILEQLNRRGKGPLAQPQPTNTRLVDKTLQQAEGKKAKESKATEDTKNRLKEMMKNKIRKMKAKRKLRVTPARLQNACLLRQRIQHSERYSAYLAEGKFKKVKITQGATNTTAKRKAQLRREMFNACKKMIVANSASQMNSPDHFNLPDIPGWTPGNVNINSSPSPAQAKPSPIAMSQSVRPLSIFPQYKSNQATPRSVTSVKAIAQTEALVQLRQQMQKDALAKSESEPSKKKAKKIAQLEGDETGNWVPLDEYYYGKTEGDPTYHEQKGELRFKCWYCNKMLYNNVAAMMHIQGHIDAERQVNLDLSDLTQCKHCYKQFDTPFEMQTHIEKVHMNNASVLLCRICEKDHDTRHGLTDHMKRNHNACEMPYICQLCKFRSSMYSDVVDHFKKKHNSSESMLCLYCLRVYQIRFVSQGWGQTSIYYNHLMKHQIKNCCKKCTHCKLIFLNSVDLKTHRKTDHLPNQKGVIGINAKYTTPHQVMIKVTEKPDQPTGGIKSLNVPAVKKILEHKLSFPSNVYKVKCIECKMLMGMPDHYKKFIQCSMCRFATSCSFAYAHHMMGFHSGQLTAAASHTPTEAKLEDTLYCACGFQSSFGNRIDAPSMQKIIASYALSMV